MLSAVAFACWKAYDKGRSWLLFVPERPGAMLEMKRARLPKGELRQKVQGSDGEHERIIASDQAHYVSKRGPVWLIGQSTGWNLVAPTKHDAPKLYDAKLRDLDEPAQTASEDLYARMLVADPLCYERSIEQNDFADFVNSKNEKDPWQVRIAGLVLVALLFTLVSAGGTVYLIQKAAAIVQFMPGLLGGF